MQDVTTKWKFMQKHYEINNDVIVFPNGVNLEIHSDNLISLILYAFIRTDRERFVKPFVRLKPMHTLFEPMFE